LASVEAERVRHVIVDEYQDVNPIQEAIVWLLHDLGANVCVVGDDDQTIYQWRGSDVQNILSFATRYPDVQQVRLEEHFRSSPGIVETARVFIEQNPQKPTDAQPHDAGDIVALSFDSPDAEAADIGETIGALRGVRSQIGVDLTCDAAIRREAPSPDGYSGQARRRTGTQSVPGAADAT
jgi:DNA helicase-2/ATP-dependent DNA helicase PcrA